MLPFHCVPHCDMDRIHASSQPVASTTQDPYLCTPFPCSAAPTTLTIPQAWTFRLLFAPLQSGLAAVFVPPGPSHAPACTVGGDGPARCNLAPSVVLALLGVCASGHWWPHSHSDRWQEDKAAGTHRQCAVRQAAHQVGVVGRVHATLLLISYVFTASM